MCDSMYGKRFGIRGRGWPSRLPDRQSVSVFGGRILKADATLAHLGWKMKSAKQIVFRYNGDSATEEVLVDLDGEETVPEKGAVIARKGKQWKVVMVTTEQTVNVPKAVPVHRVYLTDQA